MCECDWLYCALSIVAQCIVIGPVCGGRMGGRAGGQCLWWAGGRCLLPQYLEIASGSVGAGSDNLQLIKFWQSCTPGKGVCGGAKIFGSVLLQPARSVCISLSAFFIEIVFCGYV